MNTVQKQTNRKLWSSITIRQTPTPSEELLPEEDGLFHN